MENTGFYVIPNKTQYEIGERVYLEIRKTGPTKANHVKVSLFTYQGENLKMECTLEQGVYIPLAESISEKTGGYLCIPSRIHMEQIPLLPNQYFL